MARNKINDTTNNLDKFLEIDYSKMNTNFERYKCL